MGKKVLDVLYQTDNNYAVVTGVSIASLIENNREIDELTIHLIDGGVAEQNIKKIKQLVASHGRRLNVIDGKDIEKRLKSMGCRPYKGSYVTYYKLLVYDMIKTKANRLLMLDGDILVLKSLSGICDIDLDGYIMAEVVDAYMPQYLIRRLGIPKGQPYYNAGVMLINQDLWRSERCEDQIMHHWKNVRSDYTFADQDVTNILFGERIKELDLTYNFYSKNYMLAPHETVLFNLNKDMLSRIGQEGPTCVHCIDESWQSRPWFKGNSHTMGRLWDEYLGRTPWSDWGKLDIQLNAYNKVDRLAYRVLPRYLYAVLLRIVSSVFASMDISRRLLDRKKMSIKD